MIEIQNLTKRFDEVTALDSLCCTISEGSVFGLVGSNGSGKSTLLRIISGVFQPDMGQVLIDGHSTFENIEVKEKCFFVSDFPYFFNDSTLVNMASIYRKLYPNWSEERYTQLCAMFPINSKAKIISMSKGMQRQAALILALSAMPEYLFLDEIFDGLDPVVRQLVKKLIVDDVSSRKMTVVIASHNLRELEDVCDHIGLLHRGGIVLERELDQLKLGIHRVQIAFSAPLAEDAFSGIEIVKMEQRGSLYNLVVRGEPEQFMPYLKSLNPVLVEALPLTLEEVFISEMEVAGYDINNIL